MKAANIFWPCVLIVLDHVTSARLETLQFECQLEDLESLALPQLDYLLARPVFGRLSKVKFVLADFPAANSAKIHAILTKRLPVTATRGLLVVQ